MIHRAMQREGHVDHAEHRARVLVARQEITGADRQWAERYDRGDVVRYTKGSKTFGIEAGEYARVEHVNAKENLVTVRRDDGDRVTYDPRRLQGRHALSRDRPRVREGRPRAVHGAGSGAARRES